MPEKHDPQKNIAPQIICNHPDDVKRVKALPDYCLQVEFVDQTSGLVYMKDFIFGPKAGVFSSLKNESLFNDVYVEYGVTTWPGELDLSPDVMYSELRKRGEWVL